MSDNNLDREFVRIAEKMKREGVDAGLINAAKDVSQYTHWIFTFMKLWDLELREKEKADLLLDIRDEIVEHRKNPN